MYIALIVILNEIETCKETHVCEIVSEWRRMSAIDWDVAGESFGQFQSLLLWNERQR